MIDIIEQIKELRVEAQVHRNNGTRKRLNEAADTIELLYKKQSANEWIPCSERLPENISTVIVQVKEIEKPTFGWYEDMDNRWALSEKDFVDLEKFTVIAWQPLPEAYHE